MKVEDIMTHPVFSCSPQDSLERAAQLMWDHDCGCLPVVSDEGDLVGIVTDRDLCMAAYTRGKSLRDVCVDAAMSDRVVSCRPRDEIAQVEELMRHHQLRRLPVLDLWDSLVGMITLSDIARHAESHALRGAIEGPQIARTLATICSPRHAQAAE